MEPIGQGAYGWRGPTGSVLELWPPDSWEGPPVDTRRDYAIVIKPNDRSGLLRRMTHLEFRFQDGVAGGRLMSSVDPVLGIRFALED
jgi:hypothetical protein